MQGKNIATVTLEELFQESIDASIPVLVDIQHESIVWQDNDEQENGHLRLINDTVPVRYKGADNEPKMYYPSVFSFTPPSEDGKSVGNTKVSISCIDQRVIQVIRGVDTKVKASFVAFFAKQEQVYKFQKLYHYDFEMNGVSWDGITASWNLVFDPAMQLNVPRDLGTAARFPSVRAGD